MRRGFASSDPMGLRVHIIPGLHSGIGRNQGLDVRGSSGHHHQGISSHPLSHSMIAGGAFAKTFQSKTSSEL